MKPEPIREVEYVLFKCQLCGDTITMTASQARNRRFCSMKCAATARSAKKQKRTAILKCQCCGREKEVDPREARMRQYCSRECAIAARLEELGKDTTTRVCAVCKKGNRFAALEPISQGVLKEFGSVEAGITRGLQLMLRMDSGSQYRSEDFLNQVKAWGITPSFSFVREPETNGVAERFIRTLKEQVIYGRTFRTIEEVRQAVAKFVPLYNNEWRLEKNGYLSPLQMRETYYERTAA